MSTIKQPRTNLYALSAVIATIVLTVGICFAGMTGRKGQVRATPYSMDFYGQIDGSKAGDILTVSDPEGTICGEFTIKESGQYGFIHVYGDDRSTAVDEGGVAGDELRFELNGHVLTPVSFEAVYWLGDRQRKRVDFTL